MTDDGQTDAAARDADFERFCEEITMASVGETVAKLLTHPFGFHGDTGIRDYLYARLHVNGGDRLDDDDPRPGYPTLLLQSEHYTVAKYISGGETARGARFDLALTRPPAPSCDLEDRCAERLTALFAFELGKNKSFDKVIDPEMVDHSVGVADGDERRLQAVSRARPARPPAGMGDRVLRLPRDARGDDHRESARDLPGARVAGRQEAGRDLRRVLGRRRAPRLVQRCGCADGAHRAASGARARGRVRSAHGLARAGEAARSDGSARVGVAVRDPRMGRGLAAERDDRGGLRRSRRVRRPDRSDRWLRRARPQVAVRESQLRQEDEHRADPSPAGRYRSGAQATQRHGSRRRSFERFPSRRLRATRVQTLAGWTGRDCLRPRRARPSRISSRTKWTSLATTTPSGGTW